MTSKKNAYKNGIITIAKNYPFEVPNYSYIFVNGAELKLVEFNPDSLIDSVVIVNGKTQELREYLSSKKIDVSSTLSDKYPILSYGSNASIKQLQKKFSNFSQDVVIPIIRARLYDFDVVYSAHFSPYGSIPATLQYSPKTIVDIFVIYLTYSQIKHMNKTESLGINYCLGKLSNIKLTLENNIALNEILLYSTLHGCLFVNGSHISLSSIVAQNRKFPQMNELEVLLLVNNILDKDKEIDAFIYENITDIEIKKNRIEKLKQLSKHFYYKGFEILGD